MQNFTTVVNFCTHPHFRPNPSPTQPPLTFARATAYRRLIPAEIATASSTPAYPR